jgi:hypothetical protein
MIILNRGDTYEFTVSLEDYNLIGDDTIYFGIMDPHQPFEEAIVKKTFTVEDISTKGILNIVIEPEDTLELLPGTYYYAIKLHLQHDTPQGYVDKVCTLQNKTKLFLND